MLVIVHGWSDRWDSFRPLAKKLLDAGLETEIEEIRLGDWLSLDDEVTYDDLADALERAWRKRGLPDAPHSADVVIHSTGALIIRCWQLRFYQAATTPVHRLLMLAPANFGSPLAHTGRSVFGRAVKGWGGSRLFETGAHILEGLEIAGRFSLELAERDWFSDAAWFGPGRILCTVLTGNAGYNGIRALANRPGSDGTVRVSTANLNAARLTVDFHSDPHNPVYELETKTANRTAFGLMDGENHSTICAKDRGPRNNATLPAMVRALTVTDNEFDQWARELEAINREVMDRRNKGRTAHYHGYQNTVFRVRDQFGNPVTDYVIEFFVNADYGRRGQRMTRDFHEQVIDNVHVFKGDASLRSFLINCRALERLLDRSDDYLYISITASPEINSREVGFRTYNDDDIGDLALSREQVSKLFVQNRTLIVDLTLKREQSENVFRLHDA